MASVRQSNVDGEIALASNTNAVKCFDDTQVVMTYQRIQLAGGQPAPPPL